MPLISMQMKFFLCAGVVTSAMRNLLPGSVRPYPRSLIESVSSTIPLTYSEKSSACEPSQSFKPPNFLQGQRGYTLHSLSDSRLYLQGLEYESRKDDMRRAYEMRDAWIDSILKELVAIKSGMTRRNMEGVSVQRAVQSLTIKALAASNHPNPPNPTLDITPGQDGTLQNHITDTQSGAIRRDESGDNPLKWNTPQGWTALRDHHYAAHASFGSIIDAITEIGKESIAMFNGHNKQVSTSSSYQLKWPSFLSESDLKEICAEVNPEGLLGGLLGGKSPKSDFKQLDKKLGALLGAITIPDPLKESSGISSLEKYLSTNVEAELAAIVNLVTSSPPSNPSPSDASEPVLSFSQRMSVLNAKLNWLNSLRLGNDDAQNSLLDLINRVKVPITRLTAKITESLARIRNGLIEIDSAVWGVYYDAKGFTSEVSPELSKDFDTAIGHLSTAINLKNNHASLPGRTKYIVDTVRMMHTSLIALVDAHGETAVYDADAAAAGDANKLALIKTNLLKVTENAGLNGVPQAFNGPVENPSGLKDAIVALAEKADKTSKCILYGDVDGAQVFDRLNLKPSPEVCEEAHAYAKQVLEKKYAAYEATRDSA